MLGCDCRTLIRSLSFFRLFINLFDQSKIPIFANQSMEVDLSVPSLTSHAASWPEIGPRIVSWECADAPRCRRWRALTARPCWALSLSLSLALDNYQLDTPEMGQMFAE